MDRVSCVYMRKTIAICTFAVGALVGCSQNDSSSDRSVSIDLDKQKESVQKTLNNAERELKKGAREAQAKLEKAGDTLKQKAEEVKDKLTDDKKAEVKVDVKK